MLILFTQKSAKQDGTTFREELKNICQCYLPHAQCYNSSLNDIFYPVPNIKFDRVCTCKSYHFGI